MRRPLTNDFSWSKSRHEKLEECARAYFFHYYGSWGGWDSRAAERTRALYVLKKLHNRWTWTGTIVHDTVKQALDMFRAGREPNPAECIEGARQRMRNHFRHSVAKRGWKEKTKDGFFGLLEHEYEEGLTDDVWKANWENAKAALEWFFQSRWPAFARSLPKERWLEVDEGFLTSHFELDGVKVFAIPDFAYIAEDGVPIVVDWKTGKSREGYDAQVLGYALYLGTRYKHPPETVRAQLVYLNEGLEQEVSVDAEALETFRAHFRQSVERMRSFLEDVGENRARGEAAFPMTENLSTCGRCGFRRICGREAPVAQVQPNVA